MNVYGDLPMIKRDLKRVRARKSVSQRLRIYIALVMKEFATSSDELLRRAEGRVAERLNDRPSTGGLE